MAKSERDLRRLHWVVHSPSPYNDSLFSALADEPGVRLKVYFCRRRTGKHFWANRQAVGFESRSLNRIGGIDFRMVLSARPRRGFWIFGGWREPSVHLAAWRLARAGAPYAVWTDRPNLQRRRGGVKRLVRDATLSSLLGNATHIMGTGQPTLDTLITMGIPREKLVNFPYYIDTEAFSPGHRQRQQVGQRVVFLSCGRLHMGDKGLDLAIEALATVARDRPELDFCWRIAGSGPDNLALRRLAEAAGIAERIEWLAWIEAADLPEFYRSGDVFLFPSRVEPYGVAALEAMATGLAVIGSDAAAVVEDRIKAGVNGLVHESNSAASLSAAIHRLLLDPSSIRMMGERARGTAELWPLTRAVETIQRLFAGTQHGPSDSEVRLLV